MGCEEEMDKEKFLKKTQRVTFEIMGERGKASG